MVNQICLLLSILGFLGINMESYQGNINVYDMDIKSPVSLVKETRYDSSVLFDQKNRKLLDSINAVSKGIYDSEALAAHYLASAQLFYSHYEDSLAYMTVNMGIEMALENELVGTLGKLFSYKGAMKVVDGQFDSSIYFLDKSISLLDEASLMSEKAKTLRLKGQAYRKTSNYAQALESYNQAYDLAKSISDTIEMLDVLGETGIIYAINGDTEAAIDIYTNAISLCNKLKPTKEQKLSESIFRSNIALELQKLGSYDRALEFFFQSQKISEEENFTYHLHLGEVNIAETYFLLESLDSAVYWAKKAYSFLHDKTPSIVLPVCEIVLGKIYIEQENWPEAEKLLLSALQNSKELGYNRGEVQALTSLSTLWLQKKLYAEAETYLKKADSLAQLHGEFDLLGTLYKSFYTHYKSIGNYREAIDAHEKYFAFTDSLNRQEIDRKLSFFEKRLELERLEKEKLEVQKERDEALLQGSVRQRNNHILTIIICSIFVITVVLTISLRQIKKKNKTLADQNDEINSQKESLQQTTEKLKLSNETKDKFFSIVAHDLKSPITTLNNLLKILGKDGRESTPQMRQKAFKALTVELSSVSKLLDNLLYWALQQKEKIEAKEETVDLSQLIHDMNVIYKLEFDLKKVSLKNEIKEELFAETDPNILQFILRNLISNSLKFTPSGGSVSISAEKQEKVLQIKVEDTGTGIHEHEKDNIFKLDYSKKGTNNEEGTGLGLSLCKEFADKINAHLDFENNSKGGVTFTLSLN